MHSHKHDSLFKQLQLIPGHLRNLLDRPIEENLPSSQTPEQLARLNTACFINQGADNFGVQVHKYEVLAVLAGGGNRVGVYRDTAAREVSVKLLSSEEWEVDVPLCAQEHMLVVELHQRHPHYCHVNESGELRMFF